MAFDIFDPEASFEDTTTTPSTTTPPKKKKPKPLPDVSNAFTGFGSPIPAGSGSPTDADLKPAVKQHPITKAVREVGSALSAPIHSPMGTLEALNEEVKGVFVDPFVELAKNPASITEKPELTGNEPGLRMVPGYKTSFDVQTPEGREHLKEHPSQIVLDVLGVLGGGNKPGQRLKPALEKGAAVVEKVGNVAAKTAPGRAVAAKVSGATAKAREVIPTARTQEVQALPAAQRAAATEVSRNIGGLLDDFKNADLNAEQMGELRRSLDEGRPPADPALAGFYDEVSAWSAADRARKLERDIPQEVKQVVVDQVEAGRIGQDIASVLGPERTAQMFDAYRKGADNPFPEMTKAWNQMRMETNRRILSRQRDAKLFEFDPEIEGVAPQVYPWRDYSKLRAAKGKLRRGKITPEVYRATVEKLAPGKYEPLLQAQKAELAMAQNRLRFEPGFGRAAYDQMTSEGMATWVELAEQGFDPVYVPREALKTLTDEARPTGPRITTAKPSSLKGTVGNAKYYETDPALMIKKNEYELANQTVVQKTVAEVYQKTGGKPYNRALQDYLDQGYTQAQAEKLVRDNWAGFKLDGTTTKPNPGQLLVRRDVGAALKNYVEKTMPTMADELFGMWMVPTLWMAPMFHVNNVLGGVHLVGLKSPGSLLDYLAYGREAYRTVKSGQMDPRIPFGAGMAPQYTKKFTRNSRIDEGGRLAKLWQKVPGHGAVDKARKFNEFVDSMNRTIVFLSEHDNALRKGMDPVTAREVAGGAARNLMQNWDSFSPLERQIIQRVYPFWGFRKAMLRTILTYPMDHPIRMQFLYQMQRDAEERANLPEEWENLVGISGLDAEGKQYFLSLKGLDPFADIHDFFTMKGFLQNLHPLYRPGLEAFGVDTYRGGVPHFAFADDPPEVDPATGMLRRPVDKSVFWDLIPQVSAFAQWAGLKDMPPPDENTPNGWLRWLDTYGSQLRVTPGISRRSMEEAEEKFRRNLETAARMQAKANGEDAGDDDLFGDLDDELFGGEDEDPFEDIEDELFAGSK